MVMHSPVRTGERLRLEQETILFMANEKGMQGMNEME